MNLWLKWVFFFFFFSFFMFFIGIYFILFKISIFMEFDLFMINCLSIIMTFYFDWMSMIFSSFVFFISSMVIIYSSDYMKGDLTLGRFYMLIVLFVFSMFFMIMSPNLISILLGWDGLGLVSYCLVIYYQNIKSYNAGMLTALSNRVGDVCLLMSLGWMFNYGSLNFIFYLFELKDDFYMIVISFFVIIASMTKSAQIPFSAWLPAAMAAPTPVSSLVHSSTLVTAGVYLLIRFNSCIIDLFFYFLLFISVITMFMSGLGANFEFDLKKIIALSTLSQLGLMMSILSMGGFNLSFFHLLSHALFKALLFMGAGMVIHGYYSFQDIRFMGKLVNLMPFTCSLINISNMSLCGLPFLSGFYSKDLIVEFMEMNYVNFYIYIIYFVSIGLTVCYSFRLFYYLNLNGFNFLSFVIIDENMKNMLIGMFGLLINVVFMGSLLNWMLFDMPYFIFLPFFIKLMVLIFILIGMLIGLEISFFSYSFLNKSLFMYKSSKFLGSMWSMPLIFIYLNFYPIIFGDKIYLMMDQGWGEYFGSRNFSLLIIMFSKIFNFFFSNTIKVYIMLMIFWMIFFFII